MFLFDDILFGIRIATYPRKTGRTKELLSRTLESVQNQDYKHWTVYLVGDVYEPIEEFESFASLLPAHKIKLKNLDHGAERFLYPPELLHYCGGTHAANHCLDWMIEDGIKHVAILDDDDLWQPNHLSSLAHGYRTFPNACFVYTKGEHVSLGVIPRETCGLSYNNLPPVEHRTLHSSVSWRLDKIPLRYTNTVETQQKPIYGDAQMWSDMKSYFKDHNYKFLHIPNNTLFHDGV